MGVQTFGGVLLVALGPAMNAPDPLPERVCGGSGEGAATVGDGDGDGDAEGTGASDPGDPLFGRADVRSVAVCGLQMAGFGTLTVPAAAGVVAPLVSTCAIAVASRGMPVPARVKVKVPLSAVKGPAPTSLPVTLHLASFGVAAASGA